MASPAPSLSDSDSSETFHYPGEDQRHERVPSLDFSEPDEDEEDAHEGDYSTRMDELFDDENGTEGDDGDDEEEAFIYDGADAGGSTGDYRAQLRDVLGPDAEEEEEGIENSEDRTNNVLHEPVENSDFGSQVRAHSRHAHFMPLIYARL